MVLVHFCKKAQVEPTISITANNQNRVAHSETAAECQSLGWSSNCEWRKGEWRGVNKESDKGRTDDRGRYHKGTNESSQTNEEGEKENTNVAVTTELTR